MIMSRCHLPDSWHAPDAQSDIEALKERIYRNLEYRLARDLSHATAHDLFLSTAYAALEYVAERWIQTRKTHIAEQPKRVYYLSMEFLMGRSLTNALINTGLYDVAKAAVATLTDRKIDIDDLEEVCEVDAALGNGGLGRLAACFLDSLATMELPAWGYGIRYNFGLFKQHIVNGQQMEQPDNWLRDTNPWEVMRPNYTPTIRFGGSVAHPHGDDPTLPARWQTCDTVQAVAYDTPVPGYHTETVNTLRLWSARATDAFDLQCFNGGDYVDACKTQVLSENISKVLYPNDGHLAGKALRLKQEYFLVAASLWDIVDRFEQEFGTQWALLPEKVAIQLNDTHPALAIPELMRMLVDEKGVAWNEAWALTTRVFAYTNHTLMGEALEVWPVELIATWLPRHLEIIYRINHDFLTEVAARYPGDDARRTAMSLIQEPDQHHVKSVRMAWLAVVGSHKVNGVAALHSRLMRETIFRHFAELWPERFTNKTNGVTPRRWLLKANTCLAELITEAIGPGWITNLDELRKLEPFADDLAFRQRWQAVKAGNKAAMARDIRALGLGEVDPASLFDVQVKRIHLYKRQLLFALQIAASYLRIKANPAAEVVPRTCLIGGKAAPGYAAAKDVIRFITRLAEVVNADSDVRGRLRVLFLPDYRVSLAERLIPAADLSEQISTAGLEASGTGNMKFALNGALTIGTLDGANIEIREEVGEQNIFIFGHTADELAAMTAAGYRPDAFVDASEELGRVLELLRTNFYSATDPHAFAGLYRELMGDGYYGGERDRYRVLADFDRYMTCHALAEEAYRNQDTWTRAAILNVARCGKFSSDRTIREYAEEIWHVQPLPVPAHDAGTSKQPVMID
jgi:starch phosphorylase